MEKDLRDSALDAVDALKEMHETGRLEADKLYKGLIAIALIFAEGGDNASVTKILMDIPTAYYKEVQIAQMEADPDFAEVCGVLARLLILHGMTDMGPVITQPPGVA